MKSKIIARCKENICQMSGSTNAGKPGSDAKDLNSKEGEPSWHAAKKRLRLGGEDRHKVGRPDSGTRKKHRVNDSRGPARLMKSLREGPGRRGTEERRTLINREADV